MNASIKHFVTLKNALTCKAPLYIKEKMSTINNLCLLFNLEISGLRGNLYGG